MSKKIAFYIKMGYKLIRKDVIEKEDYKSGYDKVSDTYINWINEMGRYTDRIIKPKYIFKKDNPNILDFACGTGYITKNILKQNINCHITAVDFSEGMLKELKALEGDRLNIVHSEGIEFLETTKGTYDVIFFGWALSYFNYKETFRLFKRVLNPGGIVCIITNIKGTLSGIEKIFLQVMYKNTEEIVKPMDIKFNLPNGREGLKSWFKKYGFEDLEIHEDEVLRVFESPNKLLKWLNETGALAGTLSIFKNYDLVKDELIKEIKKLKYRDGNYEINHKFVYGIFRLK